MTTNIDDYGDNTFDTNGLSEQSPEDDDLLIAQMNEIDLTGSVTLKCGCTVEPDGICEHGNRSPMLDLGLI